MKVVELDAVYHVGASPKSRARLSTTQYGRDMYVGHYRSMEGMAYSVSLESSKWRRVLDSREPEWTLQRRDGAPGVFVFIRHKRTQTVLLREALSRGLVKWGTIYVVSWTERGKPHEYETDDADYADDAMGDLARKRPWLTKRRGLTWTSKLEQLFPGGVDEMPLKLLEDYACMAVLEVDGEVDGVWWNAGEGTKLARGAIFRSKLPEWAATR